MTNSIFSGNNADHYGGAIYNTGSANVTVSNSTYGNTGGSGGAIDNEYANVTVTNHTLSGNSAAVGGAISNYDGDVMVTNHAPVLVIAQLSVGLYIITKARWTRPIQPWLGIVLLMVEGYMPKLAR